MNKLYGFSLVELLIAVTIAGILIAGMQGLVSQALTAESIIRARNDSVQQGRFAMQLMVKSVRMTRRLMIPLGENPNTIYKESERDVLAVTMDPTQDLNRDGWADANNDKDFLDINNNGSRDAGEPERIDEDLFLDNTNDNSPGIIGIDDNGDGIVDNSSAATPHHDNDEDGVVNEDKVNGLDDDGDGSIDEDIPQDMNDDTKPGIAGVDDDYDGTVDDGTANDDDEDGVLSEDWLDPVVYFLNGTTLMQRVPNINPADGTDYQENPIAENISGFQVIRIPDGGGRVVLVDLMLEIRPVNGEPVSFRTSVGVGSGL